MSTTRARTATAVSQHLMYVHGLCDDDLPNTATKPHVIVETSEVLEALRQKRHRLRAAGVSVPADRVQADCGRLCDADLTRIPARPCQEEAIAAVSKDGVPFNGILEAATGFGKTIVALHACRGLRSPVLVVVPTNIARDQWVRKLREVGVSVYVLGSDQRLPWLKVGAVVCTYWVLTATGSIGADLRENINRALTVSYGAMILDEVHKSPADVFGTAFRLVMRSSTLGLTATLSRPDGRESLLPQLVGGDVLYSTHLDALSKSGHAPTLDVAIVRVPWHPAFDRARTAREGRTTLVNALNPCKLALMRLLLRNHGATGGSGCKAIVFCDWLRALPWVAAHVRAAGVCVFGPIAGGASDKTRQLALAAFRDAPSGALVISAVGEMALDVPELDLCIELTHKADRGRTQQRHGRTTRVGASEKRSRAVILVNDDSPELATVEKRERRAASPWANDFDRCVPPLTEAEVIALLGAATTDDAERPGKRKRCQIQARDDAESA